ncbi:MAG TPA: hypothetical protein VJN67_05770 [Stellaceae bacterium]|nr:hypothetical protein [Stellaceae bacterium]
MVAKQLGADHVVPKPFDADKLLAMIWSRLRPTAREPALTRSVHFTHPLSAILR